MKKDSCFDPACYGEKVTRFIAASNLVQLAGDYRAVPQGSAIVPRSKYTVLKSGDRCGHATQGIVAIGNNTGATGRVYREVIITSERAQTKGARKGKSA